MASAFVLFGELRADTSSFSNSLRQAEDRLRATEGAISRTEQRSRALGNTSATSARQFERYNERLTQQRNILMGASGAYQRGEISARRFQTILGQTDTRLTSLNSRLRDHGARLTDLAQKQSLFSRIGGGLSGLGGALGVGITAGGAIGLASAAIDKAIEQAKAYRLLSASATEAGLSQQVLFDRNKQFASSVGLSDVASAGTVSSISRLNAYAGGNVAQLDQLLKGFADLGAARGINGGDLQTLIGSILSGQDEGLNRLGISDPGQLYKAFAKNAGKSVESLTQQEKVQAAVNAVLEKSAMFAGAAELRMASLEGQVAKSTAAWENFTSALSTSFATSGPVTEFLATASSLIQGLGNNVDEVNKKLREGKTPEQVAKETYGGPSLGDYVSAGASSLLLNTLLPGHQLYAPSWMTDATDATKVYERRFGKYLGQVTATDTQNKLQETAAGQSRQDATISKYMAMQKAQVEKFQKDEAEKYQKQRESALTQGLQREQAAMRSNFSVQEAMLNNHLAKREASEIQSIQATTRLKNAQLQAQIATERSYYNALIANAATPEDAQRFAADRDASISAARNEITANNINAQTQIIEKTRELKKEIGSIFVGLAGENNPFVKIFDDGRLAIERIREATRGLSPEIGSLLEKMQKSATDKAYYKQSLENALQASNLRNEARQFRLGALDADNPENFQANIQRQLDAVMGVGGVTKGLQGEALNQAIAGIMSGVDPSKLNFYQQSIGADAMEAEAVRLEKQAGEEREQRKILAKLMQKLGDGLEDGHIVRIVNEAPNKARVSRKPKAADSARHYGPNWGAITPEW